MGHCIQVFIIVGNIQIVYNESEDFERDPVDWGEPVLRRPNEAKDFKSIPLEIIDLKQDTSQ